MPARPDVATVGAQAQAAGWLVAVRAIAWAFLGIRKRGASEQDAARISPLMWVGTGIAAALVFVVALVMLVHWVAGR